MHNTSEVPLIYKFTVSLITMSSNYSENLINVLFVDDEPAILASMKRAFKEKPYKSHIANSAREALELLKHRKIDVVVSDLRMPEMSGNEFIKIVHDNYPLCLKIVLSGNAKVHDVSELLNKSGIDAFLEKPWDTNQLKDKIMQLVRKRHYEEYERQETRYKLKKLQEAAGLDEITNTARREKVEEAVLAQIELYRRYSVPFSLVCFEIDNAAWIEQQLKVESWHDLLSEISQLVLKRMRIIDVLGRDEGAKFTLVCPYTTLQNAMIFAEDLRSIIENHPFGLAFKVRASFGVAEFTDLSMTLQKLHERVSMSRSEASESGGNMVLSHNW